jgi:hypothetical protein
MITLAKQRWTFRLIRVKESIKTCYVLWRNVRIKMNSRTQLYKYWLYTMKSIVKPHVIALWLASLFSVYSALYSLTKALAFLILCFYSFYVRTVDMLVKCVTLVVKMASDITQRMVFIVKPLFTCQSVVQVQRNYGRDFNLLKPSGNFTYDQV